MSIWSLSTQIAGVRIYMFKMRAMKCEVRCSQTHQIALLCGREPNPPSTTKHHIPFKWLASLWAGFVQAWVLSVGIGMLSTPVLAVEGNESDALIFKGCSIIRRAFMTEAAHAYKEATGQSIDVMGGGATLGIRATTAGDADIGGTCRPPLPDLSAKERGTQTFQIAWDALVVITYHSNPVDSITLQQLKSVLRGEIVNWRELGGPVKRIVPVFRSQSPEHGGKLSGVGYMTRKMLFGDTEIDYSARALFFRHSSEVEEAIEKVPFSFAVTGVSSANRRRVKALALDGVKPTRDNISSGAYPLYRPLYLVTRGGPSPEIRGFLDWLLSDAGQQVVSDQGTVTMSEGFRLFELFNTRNTPAQQASGK